MIKVKMIPSYEDIKGQANGIARVIEAWHKYLPPYGVEFISDENASYDIKAVHAGMTAQDCDVAHLHGMYFTADYPAQRWEYVANANIAQAVRSARAITVPSAWVAEIFQRDMHLTPYIVPHGIDYQEWENKEESMEYVLWNKNRAGMDVCSTESLGVLAGKFPTVQFVSTYMPDNPQPNISKIGVISPQEMKVYIQKAGVYLSTTKETFGIGILEAMASGVPILGYDYGGNALLVKHKINGYLAEPNNRDDLAYGLSYCIANSKQLGANGVELARLWTWQKAVEILYNVYTQAAQPDPPSVSVIIPCYNKKDTIQRAVDSALAQSYPPKEVVIVDDGSTDGSAELIDNLYSGTVKIIHQRNQGVAHARNNGILATTAKYVCCLDGDDWLNPEFLKVCVNALEADRSLGIAYTRLKAHTKDKNHYDSDWPREFDYDRQLRSSNQIPTCCVFKRTMFDRLGGYRQRYSPMGAGVEDAEFWLRAGAMGFNARLVSNEFLFNYSLGIGVTSQAGYHDYDYMAWHSWTKNGAHPFASVAKPVRISHKVRQYDEPVVSVVIPVGKGHEKEIINALDSLEAQTFTRWEAILVWDSPEEIGDYIKKAFPFIRWLKTNHPFSGPGVGRNLGAAYARGKFLMFLDADDWLYPEAIETLLIAYQSHEAIIYSDYVGKAIIDPQYATQLGDRLLQYNEKTNEAVIRHHAADYRCEEAQIQPDIEHRSLYHWCLVTCLIPRNFHEEIGGFDESMRSWEDVDYHWRMARAGKCYYRVPQPLLVYRFVTGSRRELAMDAESAQVLIKYMSEKYRSIKTMPCPGGCGQPQNDPQLILKQPVQANTQHILEGVDDSEFVMVRYTTPNTGDHNVVGAAVVGKRHINYGYRTGGDVFLVHKMDIALTPHLFQPIEMETPIAAKPTREVPREMASAPDTSIPVLSQKVELVQAENEVVDVPLVSTLKRDVSVDKFLTDFLATRMKENGFETAQEIVEAGLGVLTAIKGIGTSRAELILDAATKALK